MKEHLPFNSRGLEIILIAILYFLAVWVEKHMEFSSKCIAHISIHSGIIFTAIFLRGYNRWPGIWLGAFGACILGHLDLNSGVDFLRSVFLAVLSGVGASLAALVSTWLTLRFTGGRPFKNSENVFYFILFGALSCAGISASFNVTAHASFDMINWQQYFYVVITWWVGDILGVLLISPLVLLFLDKDKREDLLHKPVEVVLCGLFLFFVVFCGISLKHSPFSFQLSLFLVVPVLLWGVFRLSELFSYLGMLFVAVTMLLSTVFGHGPFYYGSTSQSLFELQLFLGIMSVIILLINGVLNENRENNKKLSQAREHLQGVVDKKTRRLRHALRAQKELSKNLDMATEELDEVQKELLHAHKMEALGKLAGKIAHDFNNILGIIAGCNEMTKRKIPKESQAIQYLERSTTAIKRGANLVQQIVKFSKMQETALSVIDIAPVLQENLQMIRSTIPDNIEIHEDIQQNCEKILADEDQIHQVVLNLCKNACQAMEEKGGSLTVSLRMVDQLPQSLHLPVGKYLEIKIADTGCGIPEENLKRIFEPFFTTKESGKGSGLGLSTVDGIITNHDGKIVVESVVDQGTAMKIYLPVANSEERSFSESVQGKPQHSVDSTILVVEDEPRLLEIYQQFLDNLGYKVVCCYDGLQAITLFEENPNRYDLILTDQSMPYLTGKQLSQRLLKVRPNLPIILTTGYSNNCISEEEVKAAGIREYQMKPVQLEFLQKLIEKYLPGNEVKV